MKVATIPRMTPVIAPLLTLLGIALALAAFAGTDPCYPDTDTDGDDICDNVPPGPDNCISVPNPGQANYDSDNYGDVCDNCVSTANNTQDDDDVPPDGIGNVCDPNFSGSGTVGISDFSLLAGCYGSGCGVGACGLPLCIATSPPTPTVGIADFSKLAGCYGSTVPCP